jgi:hypothetical protein
VCIVFQEKNDNILSYNMVLSENTLSDDYIRLSDNIMLSADNMSSDSIVILSDLLSDNIFLLADNVILSVFLCSHI